MGYSLNRFLKPLKETDKTIRIFDDRNFPVHTINPFSVLRLFVTNSNLNVSLSGNRTIALDFDSHDESKEALSKLQSFIDQLRQKAPATIDKETEKYIEKVIQTSVGIGSLNGITASGQSLVVEGDDNLDMTINSLGKTHSISLSWTGLLPIERGGLNNSDFYNNELLISTSDSIVSSGYTINDDGVTDKDIWSAEKVISYYKSNMVNKETPSGLVDGVNSTFVLANQILLDSEHVYLNGLLQDVGDDYTINGNVITFIYPPYPGSKIRCSYMVLSSHLI